MVEDFGKCALSESVHHVIKYVTKGDWEALRMAFTAAFQMEEVRF